MAIEKPTSTQIGAIAENIVANELIIATGGRFSPFMPVADDDGIDLLVYDKSTGGSLPLQVKARTDTLMQSGGRGRGNNVHFEVRKSAMKKERRAWVVCVLLERGMRTVERAWLFPMNRISKISDKKRDKYVMRPSKALTTKDKYSSFQCENMEEVAGRMIEILDKKNC
jgi:hypothetical protein